MEVRLPNRIAVACLTEEDARTFMQALAAYTNVRWCSGTATSPEYLNWKYYHAFTVYTIENLDLSYGSGKYARWRGIPIISVDEFLSNYGFTTLAEADDDVDLSGLF